MGGRPLPTREPWCYLQELHCLATAMAANGQQSLLLGSLQILLGDMGLTLHSPLRTLGNANHRCEI